MSIRFEKAWIPLLVLLGAFIATVVTVTLYASNKVDREEVNTMIDLRLAPLIEKVNNIKETGTRIELKVDELIKK